jgi:uncharacterized protein (DUF2236 family)
MSLMERTRVGLSISVRRRIAGHDFEDAHARIFDAPGPRWFSPEDPIWRVHPDASMFVGGIRALLLQSLHPRAMAAVSQHSGFRGDPWGRLHRTSAFLATTTYGTVGAAERMITTVNRIHARVAGRTRDGLAYRADEPELLSWVHVAEVDSFLTAHDHFGETPLAGPDRDRYIAQVGEIAARLGVPEPPSTQRELADQLDAFRPALRMTTEAREAAELLLRNPPLTGIEQLGYRSMAAGAISVLPMWARVQLGLPSMPITDRVISRPITRLTMRGLRWAIAAA